MESNLISELKKINQDITPRSEWVQQTRAFLLQQLGSEQPEKSISLGLMDYGRMVTHFFRQRMFEPAVIMMLLFASFVGTSLTVNAAFYSLPGDSLYPLKIALEKTQLALVSGDDKKVELKIEFAAKRVAELDTIVNQTNADPAQQQQQIALVVQEFKNNVIAVNDHLTKLNQTLNQLDGNITDKDKLNTVQMALSAGSKTEALAKSFDEQVSQLSDSNQPEIKAIVAQAVQSVQETNQSAQQLVKDVTRIDKELKDKGKVEGVSTSTEALDPTLLLPTSTVPVLSDTTTSTSKKIDSGETTVKVVK